MARTPLRDACKMRHPLHRRAPARIRRDVPPRTILGAILTVLASVGCGGPSVTKIRGPDKAPAYQIECVRDSDACFVAAEKACGGDFSVLDESNNGWPQGSGAYAATIQVRCYAAARAERDGGAPVQDAGSDASPPKRKRKPRKK